MNRRRFLKNVGVGAAVLGLPVRYALSENGTGKALPGNKLNVLFIMTDQQFADIMSCRMSAKYINTPAMDSLAEDGMLFTEAYTAKQPKQWRDYVVVQNFMTQGGLVDGKTPQVKGRMVRSKSYKYCLYDHSKHREELFDMKNDRLEKENLVTKPQSQKILKQHRQYLKTFAVKHKDKTALEMLKQV